VKIAEKIFKVRGQWSTSWWGNVHFSGRGLGYSNLRPSVRCTCVRRRHTDQWCGFPRPCKTPIFNLFSLVAPQP